jgi:hypothetical protein
MLVGITAGLLLTTFEAHAAVPSDGCEVVECADGKVFCSPNVDPGETQAGGSGAGKAVKCMSTVVDAPCSEVPACGRRVPVIGGFGLSVLGLAMASAGAVFLRRRYLRPEPHTP